MAGFNLIAPTVAITVAICSGQRRRAWRGREDLLQSKANQSAASVTAFDSELISTSMATGMATGCPRRAA